MPVSHLTLESVVNEVRQALPSRDDRRTVLTDGSEFVQLER